MVMLYRQHLEAVEMDDINLMRNGAWMFSEGFLSTVTPSTCLIMFPALFHTAKFQHGFAF